MSNNTQFRALNYLLTPKDHHKHKKMPLGQTVGGDKNRSIKNRSKWAEQCPYMVMLTVPQ